MTRTQERQVLDLLKYMMAVVNQLTYKQFFTAQIAQDWYRMKETLDALELSLTEPVAPPEPVKEERPQEGVMPSRERVLTPMERRAIGERLRKGREAARARRASAPS